MHHPLSFLEKQLSRPKLLTRRSYQNLKIFIACTQHQYSKHQRKNTRVYLCMHKQHGIYIHMVKKFIDGNKSILKRKTSFYGSITIYV